MEIGKAMALSMAMRTRDDDGVVDSDTPITFQSTAYIVALVLCFIIPSVVTGIRFWLRPKNPAGGLTHSEYAMLVAQVLQLCNFILGVLLLVELDPSTPTHSPDWLLKVAFAEAFVYILTFVSIKLSVNFLYLRLTFQSRVYPWAVACLVFICVAGLGCILTQIFTCWPIESRFDGTCPWDKIKTSYLGYFSTNIVGDLFLFILPFPLIRKIKNHSLQGALSIVFAFAILAVVGSSIRISLIWEENAENQKTIIVLGPVQSAFGIIVAALPGLSSPFTRWLGARGEKSAMNLPGMSQRLGDIESSADRGVNGNGKGYVVADGSEFLTSALEGMGSDRKGSTVTTSTLVSSSRNGSVATHVRKASDWLVQVGEKIT